MTRALRLSLLLFIASACGAPRPSPEAPLPSAALPEVPSAPLAPARPHEVPSPNGSRNDPYYWLRDDTRQNPDVLAYLRAENEYAVAAMAPAKPLEDELYNEMRGRIQEDDSTVPVFEDGYWYYTRFEVGRQQPIYARRKGTMQAPEQVLLDGNALAEGHDFYQVGSYTVSRNGRWLAFVDDSVGRNEFMLHVVDLESGATLPDTANNVSPSLVWANDNQTLFYVGKEETTLRPDRVYRHVLGGTDQLVMREPDGAYYVSVGNTKSHRYLEIVLGSTTMDEVQLIDADRPERAPRVFLPREKDQLYEVEHLDGRFLIRTNRNAKNFRLVEVREGKERDPSQWKDVIPHRPDALIEDFVAFRSYIAATVRTGGLSKVEVIAGKHPAYFLEASDPSFTMDVEDTPDPDAKTVRYSYESMTTPESIYEVDPLGKQRTLLKQQPVPTYDASRYQSEYVHAAAPDGTQVPVSIVYAKNTPRDGSAPLLVYGYGSYGSSVDPHFQSSVISLLDRGWVYAIAHVRGGEELGRDWYEDGKLMHKMNTFTDFIAVTEYLVTERYGAARRVFASGGSAGGLLIGAVLNLRPDLYRGALAIVPFVDVVTTMLDESIPLTTNEFDEWGNPKEAAAYRYMLSYSPYDNVAPRAYPALYVRTGLWDSQVQYYEPTKWVAKLRANKTDENLLVMDVDMSSGHGGASGRFDRLRQTARSHSFLLLINERPDPRGADALQPSNAQPSNAQPSNAQPGNLHPVNAPAGG